MGYALSGSTITQSGGSLSSFDDPSTLSAWAAANGLSASVFLTGRQLTIQGGYKLIVNGYYTDTGYTYYFGAGSRPYIGSSGYWVSGEQALQSVANAPGFQGIAIKGAKWIVTTWTSDEAFNTGATGTLRWYGVDINSDVTLPITGQSRADFITTSASLDVQMIDCSITPRGNHRIMGGPNIKATGCDFGFGPFYFNGDLSGFSNNTVGHYLTTEVRCNIDNGRTMSGATLKFPLTTTNWVLNLGATTDVRTYRDLGLPSTLNYAGVSGYQGGIVKLTRSVSLPVVAAESTGTSVATATVYRQELGAWVAYPVASFPATLDAYVWKWTDANFAFRVAHVTEDRRLCDIRVVDYARQVATGQIDISNAPYTGKVFMLLDALVTQTNQSTVAAYTGGDSAAKAYDLAKLWMINNYAGQTAPSLSRSGTTITATKNVVLDPAAEVAYSETATTITLKAATFTGSIVTTGTVSGSGTVTGSIEDSTGVRVTVTKSGGGAFNIAARRGTTGAYTYLGYQQGVSTVTYTVPKGTPVEVVAWALGHVTYTRLIDTSAGGVNLAMEMTANAAINTALDVSGWLASITTAVDTSGAYPVFVVTVNAPMTLPDIEYAKALVHRLVSSEVALSAGFPPGSVSLLAINADEITVNQPALRIEVGSAVTATQRVYLDAFFNRAPALAINPAWELAPVRADGNQVQILRTKPSLDPGYLAAKVVATMPIAPTLAQIEASAVLAKKTDLPVAPDNAGIAAIKAKTDTLVNTDLSGVMTALGNKPTLAQIEASTVIAKKADLPVAPDNAGIAVIKAKTDTLVNTDLSGVVTALGNKPTLVQIEASTVIAKKADLPVAPDNAGIAAIKAKTDTLVNTDLSGVVTALGNKPTLAQIEATTVLAKKADLPAAPDNAGIAAIKAKVDTLANTDLSGLATQTDVATAASGVVTAVNAVAATVNTVAADVADLQGLV
jgi:hypothetical protein